ncbi:MAG: acyl-ACP thioesterase domain-containing protein [Bacteroidota bacterium]
MKKIDDIYTKDWKVEFNDCYSNGRISYVTLSRFLQDTAGYHAEEGGFGMKEMVANNQSWVLTRFAMEIDNLPKLNDIVTVKSWISFVKGAFSNREYEVYTNNRLMARATSSWTVINFKKRIVETLKIDLHEARFNTDIATERAAERISLKDNFENVFNIRVRFSALDMVQHVSNLKYLDWTFDNVDHDKILKSRLKKITVNYIKELNLDDDVSVSTSFEGSTQIIKMDKNSDKTCFAAKMEWI